MVQRTLNGQVDKAVSGLRGTGGKARKFCPSLEGYLWLVLVGLRSPREGG